MDVQLEQIRDQQKAAWDKFSVGWKKWDGLTMKFLKPFADEMIKQVQPKQGEMFLDIASGTGEPGLTIASMIGDGKVILTDLSDKMLVTAREHAEIRGITNIETIACDVSALPFADNSFDAVSCRFGFMFFPDMLLAAKEMYRVLKPGGRVSASYWGLPEKNPWITTMSSVIKKNIEMPDLAPGSPGMFRCSKPGLMTNLLKDAGFKSVMENELEAKLDVGMPEMFWRFHTEVGAPIVAALAKANDATIAKIKAEVFEILHEKFGDGSVLFEYSARVMFGEKMKDER